MKTYVQTVSLSLLKSMWKPLSLTAPEVREIMERMVHGLWQNIIGVDLGKSHK